MIQLHCWQNIIHHHRFLPEIFVSVIELAMMAIISYLLRPSNSKPQQKMDNLQLGWNRISYSDLANIQ